MQTAQTHLVLKSPKSSLLPQNTHEDLYFLSMIESWSTYFQSVLFSNISVRLNSIGRTILPNSSIFLRFLLISFKLLLSYYNIHIEFFVHSFHLLHQVYIFSTYFVKHFYGIFKVLNILPFMQYLKLFCAFFIYFKQLYQHFHYNSLN